MSSWILMADVIDSKYFDQKELGNILKNQIAEINKIYQKKILSPLTITLGDEFQGVVNSQNTAINIILTLQEYLLIHKVNMRFVIYNGVIDTDINSEMAYGMLGSGLTEARKALNDLKKGERYYLVKSPNHSRDKSIEQALEIFNTIIKKWETDKDQELISWFIKEIDYKKIALKTNKDRSQIWKRSKNMWLNEYHGIKQILNYLSK